MNTRSTGWLVTFGLVAAMLGYFGRGLRNAEVSTLAAGQLPGVDYFAAAESFSEIENARSHLDGLCLRLLCQIRLLRRELSASPGDPEPWPAQARVLASLEQGWTELQGTGRENLMLPDYLQVLREAGRDQEWLNLYLALARREPSQPLVGRLAWEALRIARGAGRLKETRATLEWAGASPIESPSREQIATALRAADAGREVAGTADREPERVDHERG